MKFCTLLLLMVSTALPADVSPIDTATAFVTAVDHGDTAAVAELIAHQPTEQPAALALARNLIASRRLAGVLHARYGKTADPLGLHPLPTTQAVARGNLAADETHATIQADSISLPMIRVDGRWKINLLADGASGTQQLWLTNHLAMATDECADDIAAGKYATIEDAKHALQLKLGAVVTKIMVNDSVTTRPTTTP